MKLFEQEERENALVKLKIDLISRYFPFSNDELLRFESILNFGESYCMSNEHIQWDNALIEVLKNKIIWKSLYNLRSLRVDVPFIQKFQKHIDFESLSHLYESPWIAEIVEEYGDKIQNLTTLFMYSPIQNIENLRKYQHKLHWRRVSRDTKLIKDETIIDEFKEKWNWDNLSSNKNLTISEDFITKYVDDLNFRKLSSNPASLELINKYPTSERWHWSNILCNPGITYNKETYSFYLNQFTNVFRKNNPEYEISDFMAKHRFLEIIFESYSGDLSFFFSSMEFSRIIPHLNIKLKSYSRLPFHFIEQYKEKLDFQSRSFISANRKIIPSEFIKENIHRFNLNHIDFYTLHLNQEILKTKTEQINWLYLSMSNTFDWSWEFIESNFTKLNLYQIGWNYGAYIHLVEKPCSRLEIIEFLETLSTN